MVSKDLVHNPAGYCMGCGVEGVALWKAGRNAHMVWFICLFIFNTVGILPIIYIFAFSKKKA